MKMKLYTKMAVTCLAACALFGFVLRGMNTNGLKELINHSSQSADGFKSACSKMTMKESPVYFVARLNNSLVIDANWEKPQWKNIAAAEIVNYMGEKPLFFPRTEVKMMYSDEYLYIIFRVQDKYVRSVTRKLNGPVYEDAAVEFFFSPNNSRPDEYFDLEINCGGTPLICYVPDKKEFTDEDIKQITIAHSMPEVVDPEIKEPVTWTIECKIPFTVLEKFTTMTRPNAGDCWKGNFFKTSSKGSNPHYITWAVVESTKPNFHLPQFFGKLKFL